MKLAIFLGILSFANLMHGADFQLKIDRLAGSLGALKVQDRSVVDEVLKLIEKGNHTAALAHLSTLNKTSPRNSSLRILTAYALLQAGNLVGAFQEAKNAEAAPDGNSYKCWFLAKVALLAGDRSMCRRELSHARKDGDMSSDVKAVEAELNKAN